MPSRTRSTRNPRAVPVPPMQRAAPPSRPAAPEGAAPGHPLPDTTATGLRLLGVDFTSAPRRSKPITAAWGTPLAPGLVRLDSLQPCSDMAAFDALLATPGPWRGAFDLPFGLPRELVQHLGWPQDWAACLDHYQGLQRPAIAATFQAFCDARPAGSKFAHRACDGPAGSSPSMKWVNPPVAFMLHAGVPALRRASVGLPGLCPGDPQRQAYEAYPGLVARELIGRRSYKSDTRAQQTPERLIARKDLVEALEQGRWRGQRVKLGHGQREALVEDAQGDQLDAVLCLAVAAWSLDQPAAGWPAGVDPLEGWILGA